nr:DUF4175 family protein [Asaia prunellae]
MPLKDKPKKAEGDFHADLTESLWAGESVIIRLHATSRSGREATSPDEKLTLPSRVFHDPTARALVSLRHRFGLDRESPAEASDELKALAWTLPQNEKGSILALLYAAAQLDDPDSENARTNVIGLCWAVALYLEDLRLTDRETAQANLEIRAAQKAVQDQIAHMRALGAAGHSEEQQQELATRMKRLREALDQRMQALMQRSMQLGTVIPDIGEAPDSGSDPVSRLMRRLQSDAAGGHSDDAMKRLEDLSKMVERMRSATPQDLAQIAQQLQARARAQAQKATLHDLIRRETTLLDHVQARLGLGQRNAKEAQQSETGSGQDLSTMSTAELLKRLGMTPPPNMEEAQNSPVVPPVLSDAETTAQHEQRRDDHAVQRALQMVAKLLNEDVKSLTGKSMEGLTKADKDMHDASHALAKVQDGPAENAIRKVLKDLAETGQQMSEAQKGKNHGGGPLALLPTMGTSGHTQGGKGKGDQNQADSDDEDSEGQGGGKTDRDPLGRKQGKGHSGADTDGTVPESDSREKAREIERELRRRDADRTRPQSELDYLDRLLKSY